MQIFARKDINNMRGSSLKRAVDDSGIKLKDLVEKSGIPQRTIYSLYEKDYVEEHYLVKLKKAGVKLQDIALSDKPIPYYDIDSTAGNTTIFQDEAPEYIKQYITVPAFNDCEMFISISGNSMYPKYCSGELVALKKINDLSVVAFGEAYVVVTKEQRLLKYVRKGSADDKWLLVSENKDFEPFEIPIKKVLHLYIVKGKITKNII